MKRLQISTSPAIFVNVTPRNVLALLVVGGVIGWFWLGGGFPMFWATK